MFDSAPKAVFQALSHSNLLKKLASRVGLRKPTSFARRFVAGESVADAIAAARRQGTFRTSGAPMGCIGVLVPVPRIVPCTG